MGNRKKKKNLRSRSASVGNGVFSSKLQNFVFGLNNYQLILQELELSFSVYKGRYYIAFVF